MEVKLKPCPFCDADNKPMGAIMRTANCGEWKHWYNGCVLSGFTIKADKIEAWNRRASKGSSIIECRPEQIHAHLVIDWLGDAHCSNCGEEVNCTEPFCQHCGARLDEPEVKEY